MRGVLIWVSMLSRLIYPFPPSHGLPYAPMTQGDLEEMAVVSAEVIIRSSPCSATCGLGVQTQMLCVPRDDQPFQGLKKRTLPGLKDCRVRRVKCLDSWHCGLQTFTVFTGQRFEMHCLGKVMEALGPFSYRVSWRYAPGVITSDDSLFSRWSAPQFDHLLMDSVTEEHAGTYRCDVQDRAFHRVKRLYSGIKVLPAGVLTLDYSSALARWDEHKSNQNLTAVSGPPYPSRNVRNILLLSMGISTSLTMLIMLGLYWLVLKMRETSSER